MINSVYIARWPNQNRIAAIQRVRSPNAVGKFARQAAYHFFQESDYTRQSCLLCKSKSLIAGTSQVPAWESFRARPILGQ